MHPSTPPVLLSLVMNRSETQDNTSYTISSFWTHDGLTQMVGSKSKLTEATPFFTPF